MSEKKNGNIADEFTDIGSLLTVVEDSEAIKKRFGRIWKSFYRNIL